ncbi:cytochrome c oxidase subunit 3 family protein [Thiohalobacter thiocyanaticus]|uniref:Cytochrome c oxidase subunit 3 family protein n=2 Tax=Thiohalobacter thiocyanaticus TaxID=585455 RepID=A0A426QJ10_9GAMM|nr:cytochrome c oxidase subunit 3 family protein [Thiohalobacter thiocyanaticus]
MTGRPDSFPLPERRAQGSAAGAAQERVAWPPGDLAIWIFILAELAVFAIFFAAYAFARMGELELFVTYQQTLDTNLALINTLALITSSYFVVRAVGRIRADDAGGCIRWLAGALLLGGVFLGVKSLEYAHLFGEGVSLSTNTFYTFYLSLTFFHFMHVVMGMVILAAVAVKAAQGHYSREVHTGVETGASYWHMVDLVWLILFPLVYVM